MAEHSGDKKTRYLVGENIPDSELYENTPASKVNIKELCSNKKVIIFGVPGAFTPGCSKTHLPGFIKNADEIKLSQNVDEIVCVAVNDPFVVSAWGNNHNASGKVRMLADTQASFTKSLGLDLDLSSVLGGVRSKRYSMVVNKGVIEEVNIEPDGTGLSCSLAENIGKMK